MKPKTKSELMAEWASQPDQLKKEREVKAVRKAMDDARAAIQDGLTRYVKKKTKARSMAKAESDPFSELAGWESVEQIQNAYGYDEITADKRDKLLDLWEAREAARKELLDSAFFYNRAKKQLPVLSPELYTVHHCIDGNYGIADLRGVRKLIEGGGFDG